MKGDLKNYFLASVGANADGTITKLTRKDIINKIYKKFIDETRQEFLQTRQDDENFALDYNKTDEVS